jgi:hypothetical protein
VDFYIQDLVPVKGVQVQVLSSALRSDYMTRTCGDWSQVLVGWVFPILTNLPHFSLISEPFPFWMESITRSLIVSSSKAT